MTRRRLLWFAGILLALLAAVEGVARLSGIASVPLYQVDREIGYIPAPNQAGAFLRRNDWIFNERSMGAPSFAPEGKTNILLLGDSIVFGGDAYRQREKLGPCLENALQGRYAVWPIGAGHWEALNEMAYLQRNPDILPLMDTLVWVLITVDFERKQQSWSPLIHPQRPPLLASVFGLRRFILPRLRLISDPAYRATEPDGVVPIDKNLPAFDAFLASVHAAHPTLRIFLLQYPSSDELTQEKAPAEAIAVKLRALAGRLGIGYFQVSKDFRWQTSYYRDVIHPTPAGNDALARQLAVRLAQPHDR